MPRATAEPPIVYSRIRAQPTNQANLRTTTAFELRTEGIHVVLRKDAHVLDLLHAQDPHPPSKSVKDSSQP